MIEEGHRVEPPPRAAPVERFPEQPEGQGEEQQGDKPSESEAGEPQASENEASAEASAALDTPSRRAIRSAIFLPRRCATLLGEVCSPSASNVARIML